MNNYIKFVFILSGNMTKMTFNRCLIVIFPRFCPHFFVCCCLCRFSFRSRTWEYATSSTFPSSAQEAATTRWASPGTTCPGLNAQLPALEVSRLEESVSYADFSSISLDFLWSQKCVCSFSSVEEHQGVV